MRTTLLAAAVATAALPGLAVADDIDTVRAFRPNPTPDP